jgi:hypothetical protein
MAKFSQVGFTGLQLVTTSDGSRTVYGERPGPAGARTVLLYAHYDVQRLQKQFSCRDMQQRSELADAMLKRGVPSDAISVSLASIIGCSRALAARSPATSSNTAGPSGTHHR